ncbi:general substrate transporter [Vararia minispora EC-137]|uniref:General substrate transporter n=1 Tax=Vararia minispora EC-137 TaxID=1314806 RepID=A0ACB8Q7W1_9AGAM|nr:general substrate transporter [Vararia minispora EC-137]
MSGRNLLWAINFVAGLAIFFFGYDQGMMGGVNTSPHYVTTMGLGTIAYDPSQGYVATVTNPTRQGGIVSIYYFGCLIGALPAGWLGDKIGRLKTLLFGALWVCFGAALQCSAQNVAWMCCARVINGIGTGFLNVIVPVWSAEVASHKSRGAFIAMEFTLNIAGVVVAYWLEFGLGFVGDGNTEVRWRFPIAFQLVPLLLFVVCLPWMPESPRWLVKAGRNDEAREILGRLRSEGDPDGVVALAEYEDIVAIVKLEKEHATRNSYWRMFWGTKGETLNVPRRIQLSVWLQIVQEWVGIAAITVYAPTIFAEAGYNARKSQWLSGLNDITYMLSTLLAVWTIDKWGRRVGLWWGAVGQGIALFLAGAFGRLLKDNPDMKVQYGAASATFIFVYTFVFGATWLTIPWVYPTETFPLEVRAKGMAWGVVGWSIGNGWLTLLNPVMFSAIGENTLHIFAAVNFLSIPLVWAFYPETANRTLEEIDLLFATKSPFVWDMERNFARLKAEHAELSHVTNAGVGGEKAKPDMLEVEDSKAPA